MKNKFSARMLPGFWPQSVSFSWCLPGMSHTNITKYFFFSYRKIFSHHKDTKTGKNNEEQMEPMKTFIECSKPNESSFISLIFACSKCTD